MVSIKKLALALLVVATPVVAETGDDGHFHGKGAFFEIKEKLKLSEDQKKQMKELRKGESGFERQKAVMDEKGKLRELIKAQGTGDNEIMAQLEKVNKMQVEANNSKVKNILALKKILNPEQFQILSEHMESKREEFREKFRERFSKKSGVPN